MTTDKHIPEENPKIVIKLENNPAIEKYVNRFNAAGKRTVAEFLAQAAVIAEVHADLGERQDRKLGRRRKSKHEDAFGLYRCA
jgi:hypothetical protein